MAKYWFGYLGSNVPSKNRKFQLTAFNSPRFPFLAKCALRLALALPAHTPHSERSTLEKPRTRTRNGFGNAGDKQSSTMAVSLKTSAAKRYILHSGSSAVPSLWAKRIVAIRPIDSCSTERSSAEVGEAVESPTPTPAWCGVSVSKPISEIDGRMKRAETGNGKEGVWKR
jgi:hypothetical protein